jgi:hypothetical protein
VGEVVAVGRVVTVAWMVVGVDATAVVVVVVEGGLAPATVVVAGEPVAPVPSAPSEIADGAERKLSTPARPTKVPVMTKGARRISLLEGEYFVVDLFVGHA